MSWTKYNIGEKSGKLLSTQFFEHPLWRTQIERRSPRKACIRDLEYMTYCSKCYQRYSPACKYCDLDGTCSYHGIDFEEGHCPLCGNTFQEDWDRYIVYTDKFKRGLI